MTPGTTTWAQAVPALLVAAGLLWVPGVVAARLLGVRWFAAVGVAPALSTSLLVAGGCGASLAGMPWGLPAVCLTVAAGWLLAAGVGLLMRRRGSARESVASRAGRERSVTPATLGAPSAPQSPWLRAAALAGGLAFTLAAVAVVLIKVTGTPDHFPQHPDTIFHLGDALWMLQHHDASVLDAFGFMGRTSTYPAAFHVVTSTTALLSGANVVVATEAAVVVMGGLVWPAGIVLLATTLLGARAEVIGASAVSSVLFTAFPFTIMGFGVLWPNLFGQALLPGVLALALAALAPVLALRDPAATPGLAALVTVASLPGLTMAHPNALITFLVLGFLIVAVATIRGAWERRRQPVALLVRLTALLIATAAGVAVATSIRPGSMVATGAPGPETGLRKALVDTVLFGPRAAQQLVLLTVVVAIGAWLLLRRRGTQWVPVGLALFLGLYFLNVAVDSTATRYLTWPWYNNAIRLAVAGSLPAVLCAAAGFLALGAWLTRLVRGRLDRMVATTLVVAAFVVVTMGYVHQHRAFLTSYFHPRPALSWASDDELRALRTLSTHIPPGAITAANAWNGGTYLYIVSGRPLLVPTEKALFPGDRTLLAARLADAATSPEVCAAARRQRVGYAITGGQPFAWAGAQRVAQYRGIDGVGRSPAFTFVAAAGPYRLYRLTTCASG